MEKLLVNPTIKSTKEVPTSSQASLALKRSKTSLRPEDTRPQRSVDSEDSKEAIPKLPITTRPPIPPAQVAMVYNNYIQSQASLLEYNNWYSVRELTNTLRVLQRDDFSIAAQRTAALAMLNGLNSEAPFAAGRRFPEHGHYICEMRGYQQYFLQLRASLNYKEAKETKHGVAEKHTTAEFNDSMLSYFHSINSILQHIGSRTEVYSRANFEANFALAWQ